VLFFIIVSALFLVPVTVCLIGIIVSETRLKEFAKWLMKLACMPRLSSNFFVCTEEDKNQKINRFIKQTEKDLNKFQQEQENERTMIKTKQHVNLFQDYIKETEDDSTPIHEIDHHKLFIIVSGLE
jgi:hypothetical protein